MYEPPLQMPMPRRQFASPTPTITPNATPAMRTTSSSNLGAEPPVDEIREIFLGQRATPDSLLTEGPTNLSLSTGSLSLTRQMSNLSIDSTGNEIDPNFEQPQFTFDLPTMESSVSPAPPTLELIRSGNPMEKNMGVLTDMTGSLTLMHQRLRNTKATEDGRGAELGLLSLSPPRTFAYNAPYMRPQRI